MIDQASWVAYWWLALTEINSPLPQLLHKNSQMVTIFSFAISMNGLHLSTRITFISFKFYLIWFSQPFSHVKICLKPVVLALWSLCYLPIRWAYFVHFVPIPDETVHNKNDYHVTSLFSRDTRYLRFSTQSARWHYWASSLIKARRQERGL